MIGNIFYSGNVKSLNCLFAIYKKKGIYKALRNSTNHTEALSMNLIVLQRGIYYSHLSSVSM